MHRALIDMASFDLTPIDWVAAIISCLWFYLCCLAIYRLYLSPIAHIPGPKLAALTLWYEFYYDVIKRGKYTFKIAEMHEQYGTPLRLRRSSPQLLTEQQDRLFVSIPTKFMSTIQTSTIGSM